MRLVVPDEDGADSADCNGLLTPEGTKERLCVFLVSHREDGRDSGFRTSISVTGDEGEASVDAVGGNDMTGIGVRLTEALERSEEEGATLVVCFDSLTDLLRYNDEKASYVFMHLLAGRLKGHDAVGHVHVDPGAVGEDTVKRFEPLFDETIGLD
jgi:hypothetical protein